LRFFDCRFFDLPALLLDPNLSCPLGEMDSRSLGWASGRLCNLMCGGDDVGDTCVDIVCVGDACETDVSEGDGCKEDVCDDV